MPRICVFTGSRPGKNAAYVAAATEVGALLARERIGLVFGAGHIGLMGALADAALAEGGEVIGVIPRSLVDREQAHPEIEDVRIVTTMHERKALMNQLSDAFLVLPGGVGTLEELFEVYSWATLGLHDKPIGILDVDGYFEGLIRFIDQMVEEGFVSTDARALIHYGTEARALIAELL